MKGIILAGGMGTRLYPATKVVSKQLLAIYDKPMIFYPLSILMLAGIKEILIITTPNDINNFKLLLKNGEDYGINISYSVQEKPKGLVEAFIIGEEFIGDDQVCLILGDNIFYGNGLTDLLVKSIQITKEKSEAVILGYYVNNPASYGVVEFDKQNKVKSIEEKPISPKSNYAIVGLYFYPNSVINISKLVEPSPRGELEISTLNNIYLEREKLNIQIMHRGFTWLDTGTHDNMLEASKFISTIEKRQGLKVSCIEEIAYKKGFIDKKKLIKIIEDYKENSYSKYLKKLLV